MLEAKELYKKRVSEANQRREYLKDHPEHLQKLIDGGINPNLYDRDALSIYESFAISEGNRLKLGLAMDWLHLLNRIGSITKNLAIISQVADMQFIVHPNLHKHHAREGYNNEGGIVAVIHAGITAYNYILLDILDPSNKQLYTAYQRSTRAMESIEDTRVSVSEYHELPDF